MAWMPVIGFSVDMMSTSLVATRHKRAEHFYFFNIHQTRCWVK